jgi:hypothetical protein
MGTKMTKAKRLPRYIKKNKKKLMVKTSLNIILNMKHEKSNKKCKIFKIKI